MKNKKALVALSLSRKIIEVFSDFFLGIYLFKLVNGNFNFLLLYSAINAFLGCATDFFLMKYLSQKNANLIFRSSYLCQILSILMLLVLKENVLNLIWIFAIVNRYAKSSYYAVWEVTLIKSTKNTSLSSYIAGTSILSGLISLLAPIFMGLLITDYSYAAVFILMLIDALIAIIIATKANFTVIDNKFRLLEYWEKAARRKNLRRAYGSFFLRRLSSSDGVLEYLLPVMLFLALGTEFSAGSFDAIFSVVYIILLEIVRLINRRKIRKRFYVPLALLCLASAVFMVIDFSTLSILTFYFTLKTGGHLTMTESSSMIYAIGKKEKLSTYTREHQFTWNLFLMLGSLAGTLIAYVVYNYLYTTEALAIVIVILMVFFVFHAYLLQKIEAALNNA